MTRGSTVGTVVRSVLIGAALLVLATAAHHGFVTVPVVVDGVETVARAGTTVADVAAAASAAHPGDLLGAADHRVVEQGGGDPVIVLVNGEVTDTAELVHAGDTLKTYSGADVVEPVVVETRTVDAPPQVIGVGAVERVITPGTVGVARVTVGAVSGDVVATETIRPGTPALVRLVPEPGTKVVALTFDDGPWPGQTQAILDILDAKDVPATFFMLGSRVKAMPDIARRVVAEGHAVGNHTFRHVHLDSAEPKQVRSEIVSTNRIIAQATGVDPVWFRAPGGQVAPAVFAELKRHGMKSALWNVDPQDWRDNVRASAISRAVVGAARPGSVILLHDGGGDQTETIKALPWIIDGLRERGYQFVTLEEMERVKASW